MTEEMDVHQGKSIGDLGQEVSWFLLHTAIAVSVVALMLFIGVAIHVNADAVNPKIVATFLAFLLPFLLGFIVVKVRPDFVAPKVWISGLLIFSAMWVWVIDLPTGPGLCEHCSGLMERTRRTFFSIEEGSGLVGGWGLVLGCWVPLALVAYALGARLALGREPEVID